MEHHTLSQQVLIEHQTLAFVTSALRTTLSWGCQGSDHARKLASLKFVGQSFLRHLRRLMALKEEGGYLAAVLEARPELSEQVAAARGEHDGMTHDVQRTLRRLGRVRETDPIAFDRATIELQAILDRLDQHHAQEAHLLQEALLRDEGGEG